MEANIVFFVVSLVLSLILLYIVGQVWFASTRSRYLIIFFLMGVMSSLWALLNGVSYIVPPDTVRAIETMWMIFVCCIPFMMLMYIMHFTNARLASSPLLTGLLVGAMFFDIALLLTNPLHMLFFTGYTANGHGIFGPFFWLHNFMTYAVLAAAFIILIIYVVKNVRKYPHLILIVVGSACPFIVNMLHIYNIYRIGDYDFTPLGFVVMFGVYGLFSIRFRLFNLKSAASANIFDTLSEGFLVVNNIGLIEAANPAFRQAFPQLSISRDQTTVLDVVDYMRAAAIRYSPDDLFARMSSLSDGLGDSECSVRNEKGKVYNFAVTKDFIMRRGRSAGFVLTLTDITNYRQMIAEIDQQNKILIQLKDSAEAASKSKSEFLSNMSHEIRTPINAIIGMATIARNSDDLEQIYDSLDKLNNASHQLLSIINDVLDMSKIEANKLELYNEDFIFSEMLDSCRDIIEERAGEKRQHLYFEIAETVPPGLNGDKLRLSQVVLNILSNAVKFTPEGGEIRLTAVPVAVADGQARIRVAISDSGIGMTPEQQARLFTAFEQADGSISRRFGGTGLGLAISKRIIDLMGGHIQVESSPGSGTTFTFEFEAAVSDPAGQPEQADEQKRPDDYYDFSGYHVLLVEDMEINREIIQALLAGSGISIDCAENGQEAYDKFIAAPERYDIIYMDLQMPQVDGYTATEMIRAAACPQAGQIPIIAMTANVFAEDIQRCLEIGMNDHISKPIDIHILFEKTAAFLKP